MSGKVTGKHITGIVVLCVLLGVGAGAVIVKTTTPSHFGYGRPNFSEKVKQHMQHSPKGMKPGPQKGREGMLGMLSTRLELNEEQQAKVKEILENTRKKIEETGRDLRDTILTIKKEGDEQIMALLTPAQQEKYKELLEGFEKMRKDIGNRRPRKEHRPHFQG